MRLVAGAAPHIHNEDRVVVLMGDMLVAMAPLVVMACVYFGLRALLLVVVGAVSSVVFEYLFTRLLRRPTTIADLSAVVTGVIVALCMPANAPLWYPAAGAFAAPIVAKPLFGGLGRNLVNPAQPGIVFLTLTRPGTMMSFPLPNAMGGKGAAGFVTENTVVSSLFNGTAPNVRLSEMFLGNQPGNLGTGAIVVLLVAAVYLLYRRIVSWQIPVALLGTVALFAVIFPRVGGPASTSVLYELMSGSLLFLALFMATDPSTSPVTSAGRLLYGVLIGLLTVLLRHWRLAPEGAFFALLLINPLAMPIDRLVWRARRRFGASAGGIV